MKTEFVVFEEPLFYNSTNFNFFNFFFPDMIEDSDNEVFSIILVV